MGCPGDIISFLRLWSCGRDWESAAAFLGREVVKRLQIVRGHADNLRSCFLEVADGLAERMGFRSTAARERLREEVEHDGALPELVGEVDLELPAANCAGSREIRRLVADLEGGACGRRNDGGSGECGEKLSHGGLRWIYKIVDLQNRVGGLLTAPGSKVRASHRQARRRRMRQDLQRRSRAVRCGRTRSDWIEASSHRSNRGFARRSGLSTAAMLRRIVSAAAQEADVRDRPALRRGSRCRRAGRWGCGRALRAAGK